MGDSAKRIRYSTVDKIAEAIMAEHEHGSMDIKDQEKTFDGFVKFTTYSVVGILVFLVLLAMING